MSCASAPNDQAQLDRILMVGIFSFLFLKIQNLAVEKTNYAQYRPTLHGKFSRQKL